jgi:hypothetical protein
LGGGVGGGVCGGGGVGGGGCVFVWGGGGVGLWWTIVTERRNAYKEGNDNERTDT